MIKTGTQLCRRAMHIEAASAVLVDETGVKTIRILFHRCNERGWYDVTVKIETRWQCFLVV